MNRTLGLAHMQSIAFDLREVKQRVEGLEQQRTGDTGVIPAGNLLGRDTATVEQSRAGWNPSGANTYCLRSQEQVAHGNFALKIVAIGAGDCIVITPITHAAPVIPGQTYTARAEVRAASTTRTCTVYLEWFTAASGYISGDYAGTYLSDSASEWTEIRSSIGATAPANASYATLAVVIQSCVASEVHYADKFAIFDGSTVEWP